MNYRFRGIRQGDGEQVVSMVEAADINAARQQLADMGITVREIYPAREDGQEGVPLRNPDRLLGLLSFLIPAGGLVAGAVFLTRESVTHRESGRHCLLFALYGCIAWAALVIALLKG